MYECPHLNKQMVCYFATNYVFELLYVYNIRFSCCVKTSDPRMLSPMTEPSLGGQYQFAHIDTFQGAITNKYIQTLFRHSPRTQRHFFGIARVRSDTFSAQPAYVATWIHIADAYNSIHICIRMPKASQTDLYSYTVYIQFNPYLHMHTKGVTYSYTVYTHSLHICRHMPKR